MYVLTQGYTAVVFNSTSHLPKEWDTFAPSHVFLSIPFLHVLETSSPNNMHCYFVGVFNTQNQLVGKVLVQHIDISNTELFQSKSVWINKLKHFAARFLARHILLVGNNLLTGEHAFSFNSTAVSQTQFSVLLERVHHCMLDYFKKKNIKIRLSMIKDIHEKNKSGFVQTSFKNYAWTKFQPTMIFNSHSTWHDFSDYTKALNTKYRTQLNRARKKSSQIEKKALTEDDIAYHTQTIDNLYLQVQQQAKFNTFVLPPNHFFTLKKQLQDELYVYGYFLANELVGFYTIIKNKEELQTYFLGYNNNLQKDSLLYLNMLYDMIEFCIAQKGKTLHFGRTAMEIKSSVGAIPTELFVLVKHHNMFVNAALRYGLKIFTPKINWKNRQPFK